MKKKKVTINPKIKDKKCFQHAVTVAINYGEIKWNPERVSSIKPFINKYNWTRINYLSKIDDWTRYVRKKKLFLTTKSENFSFFVRKKLLHYHLLLSKKV